MLYTVCHFSYLVVGRLCNCGVGHMLLELVLPLKKEVWSLKNRVPQKYMTFSLVPTTVKVDPAEIRVTSLSLMDFTTWKRWQTCDMTFSFTGSGQKWRFFEGAQEGPTFWSGHFGLSSGSIGKKRIQLTTSTTETRSTDKRATTTICM